MEDSSRDTRLRVAAFERVRALCEIHDHLTAQQLGEGFYVDGQRYPLVNPRRGIFKPAQMRFLLSINTVFPKTGNRVWYDDQRDVHHRIFDGDEMVDYAFMGEKPGRRRQSLATRSVREPDSDHLFSGNRAGTLSGHPSCLHWRLGQTATASSDHVRPSRRKKSSAAGDGD